VRSWAEQIHHFILRRMNQRYIQRVCGMFLAVFLLGLGASFLTQVDGQTIFGPRLGADYPTFYTAGRIYNEYAPGRIYDRPLEAALYQQVTHDPDPANSTPYAAAPFFILPFIFLSRLPYALSFVIWMLIAAALYVSGMRLAWTSTRHLPADAWKTALLVGVTFVPFLLEGIAGGQVTGFAFFWLALAVFLEFRSQAFLGGLALSVCLYKPTLLLLIIPMLLFTRRWRMLLGFALGGVVLGTASVLLVGTQGCANYLGSLLFYTGQSTAAETGLRTWKYIDFNSFYRLLAGAFPPLRWGLTLATLVAIGPLVLRAWLKDKGTSPDGRALLWALTIAWTAVLNVYFGIYDSAILVLSAILSADVLFGAGAGAVGGQSRVQGPALGHHPEHVEGAVEGPGLPVEFKYLLLLLYVTPWFTEFVAMALHVQVFTLVIAGYGFYLLNKRRAEGLKERG